jgi:hypothetical protein
MKYGDIYDKLMDMRSMMFILLPDIRALNSRSEIGALAAQARRVARTAEHLADVLEVEGGLV